MSPGGGLPLAEHLPDKCGQLRGIGLIQYNGTWIQQHQVYRHFMLLQKRQDGILSNLQCLALRIAVCTGRDQRKGNAPASMLQSQGQCIPVACLQQCRFPGVSTLP
ncbi:unknown [Ruminococcus sp. CAG:379]|nr:unknown [Ruminococcus sp. CAG:379]